MNESVFLQKLIEQGFIVLGMVACVIILIILWRLLKGDRTESNKLTREVTTALIMSSNSTDKLANVLDKNLDQLRLMPTKADLDEVEQRGNQQHLVTQNLVGQVLAEVKHKMPGEIS